MRRAGSQIAKRVIAVVMSVVMAFSLLVAGPREAQAGLISNAIECKWLTILGNGVERSVLWGIGKAQSATNNDAFAQTLGYAKQLIAGKSGIIASETLEEVKHISAQLDALYDYTVDSTKHIESLIKELMSKDAGGDFRDNAAIPVDTFTNSYSNIVKQFNDLMQASLDYSEDPTNDDKRHEYEECYNTIFYKYFKDKKYSELTGQIKELFTDPLWNVMAGGSTSFLSLISPYDSSEDINSSDDLANPESGSWVKRSGADKDYTYLGYYRTYMDTVTNFQNNVYDSMREMAGLVNNAAYLYLQAYRYFCEFQAMLYASDASLTEHELRQRTDALWVDYYDAANAVVRAINQMYYTQEDVFSNYMRSYDLYVTRSIQGYENPMQFDAMIKWYNKNCTKDCSIRWPDWGEPTDHVYTSAMQKDQHVYQFRLASKPSKVYAIRTSTGVDSNGEAFDEDDGISKAFLCSNMFAIAPDTYNFMWGQEQIGPSLDYVTVCKGLEGGFHAPAEMSELEDIADEGTSYDGQSTMTSNIWSELSVVLGKDNVHLPNVEKSSASADPKSGPNFMPLFSQLEWKLGYQDAADGLKYPDAFITLGNASMLYDPNNQARMDMEDNIRNVGDLHNKEAVVMWVADKPSSNVKLSGSGGGTTWVEIDEGTPDGVKTLDNGGSRSFAAGSTMTIYAKPEGGYTISSVSLKDEHGNVLEDLFSAVDEEIKSEDGNSITTLSISAQEMLQSRAANDDGAYEFSVPVPCQNAVVNVEYTEVDPSLLEYDVTLNDVVNEDPVEDEVDYDAVLQFGSYDYQGTKSFRKGDRVIVSVRGYNHHVATGLAVTDAEGNEVEGVTVEDVTSDTKRMGPTERVFEFDMPACDLMVSPKLGASYYVEINNNDAPHVQHTFEDLGLVSSGDDSDWSHADLVDFVEGDTVSLSYSTTTSEYIVTDILIINHATSGSIPTTMRGGKITFVMPSAPVTIKFIEGRVDLSKYMLTLDPNLKNASFQFVNQDGSGENLTKKQFDKDATVQVKAVVEDSVSIDYITLKTVGNDKNLFEDQHGACDYVSRDSKTHTRTYNVTFQMPDLNVTLSAQLHGLHSITLDSALEDAQLQFVDEVGNAQDDTELYADTNETVRARVQVTDDALTVDNIILTAAGSEENLFEAQGGAYDRSSGMVTFAMPDADATLSATLREKTPAESEGFDTDADGRILIHTYEDLVKFAEAVKDNPEYYRYQDVALTNNIDARDKEWEHPIGYIGTTTSYNATFEGNGYCIFGLRFSSDPTYLFGELGEEGVVRNLYVFDCDSEPQTLGAHDIGGLVDNNYGLIENCVVGTNEGDGVYVDPATGDLVSASQNTSAISAYNGAAGGVVAVNRDSGTIRACRSAVEMKTYKYGGGIAGWNYGTISGCVSTASIALADDGDCLGGIAGENGAWDDDGLIEGGYSAAEVAVTEGADGLAGIIVGRGVGTVVGTYYASSEGQQPFGAAEDGDQDGVQNVQALAREDMASDSFLDSLGEAQGNDGVAWVRGDGLNGGLPRIKNTTGAFGDVTLKSGGVGVTGNMHTSARLAASRIPSDSEAGRLLSAAGDGASGVAYACAIQDADGNRVPPELWVQSDVTYTVPVSSEDVDVTVLLADGSVVKPSDVSVAQTDSGYEVTFTSDYAAAFMLRGDEPGPEPTPDDGFDRDEDGNILIGSYQELVKFSQLVRQSPQTYSTADVKLSNNITATDEEAWTQGIGSKADNISYNGTFEGNGYCIYGLDVNTSQNAGLFEVIGQNGVVRNLFLFDCDGQVHADVAGGIAAYNYGRIEFCVNGVNFGNGVYINPKTNETISLRELNSTIDAGVGGGIVGNNYGTIYGCRSAAVIQGNSVGSIAGINDGTVSNCAGNSSVSSAVTDSCDCGGLVGSNSASGVVEAGYSSATISSSVPNRGNITGTQLGTIIDTYYTTSEDQLPFESSTDSTETNINGLARGNMMEDSFLGLLGGTASNSVTWIRNDRLNIGLPRIKNTSSSFDDVTLEADDFVIQGNMHLDASMAITTLSSDGDVWKLLSQDTDGYTPYAAWSYMLQDAEENYIPNELWVQSELSYTVPVPGTDVIVTAWSLDGTAWRVDGVEVEKTDTGYQATFAASGADAIMVLAQDSGSGTDTNNSGGSNNGGNSNGGAGTTTASTTTPGTTTVATRTASTGDDSLPTAVIGVIAAAAVLLIACGLVWRRRRGGRQ